MVNILAERKVNLPVVLFVNFNKCASKAEKLTAIPYGELLQRLMNAQGISDQVATASNALKKKLSKSIRQPKLGKNNFLKIYLPTIMRAMEELAKHQKWARAEGLTNEDARERVEGIRREFRTRVLSNNPPKKVPKKKSRRLILQ